MAKEAVRQRLDYLRRVEEAEAEGLLGCEREATAPNLTQERKAVILDIAKVFDRRAQAASIEREATRKIEQLLETIAANYEERPALSVLTLKAVRDFAQHQEITALLRAGELFVTKKVNRIQRGGETDRLQDVRSRTRNVD